MAKKDLRYLVSISPKGVEVEEIAAKSAKSGAGEAKAILRERDAIVTCKQLIASGNRKPQKFAFKQLDTAKTFALLYLKHLEEQLEDNLDRVQYFDG